MREKCGKAKTMKTLKHNSFYRWSRLAGIRPLKTGLVLVGLDTLKLVSFRWDLHP